MLGVALLAVAPRIEPYAGVSHIGYELVRALLGYMERASCKGSAPPVYYWHWEELNLERSSMPLCIYVEIQE